MRGSRPEFGAGTVSFLTGTVAVTLGALPDVGSEIVYAWGSQANYFKTAYISKDGRRAVIARRDLSPGDAAIAFFRRP